MPGDSGVGQRGQRSGSQLGRGARRRHPTSARAEGNSQGTRRGGAEEGQRALSVRSAAEDEVETDQRASGVEP